LFTVPQYLELDARFLQSVGLALQVKGPKSTTLQGKIVHGGTFNGNKEESKEEKETLRVSAAMRRANCEFTGLSGEAPPERLFLLSHER
jgi:hypothetical protein